MTSPCQTISSPAGQSFRSLVMYARQAEGLSYDTDFASGAAFQPIFANII